MGTPRLQPWSSLLYTPCYPPHTHRLHSNSLSQFKALCKTLCAGRCSAAVLRAAVAPGSARHRLLLRLATPVPALLAHAPLQPPGAWCSRLGGTQRQHTAEHLFFRIALPASSSWPPPQQPRAHGSPAGRGGSRPALARDAAAATAGAPEGGCCCSHLTCGRASGASGPAPAGEPLVRGAATHPPSVSRRFPPPRSCGTASHVYRAVPHMQPWSEKVSVHTWRQLEQREEAPAQRNE